MSRYIKLADALRVLADTCYLDEIDENMQKLPSIDIVFCKECEKANTEDCSLSYWDDDWGEWRVSYKGDDWFCADGERKESE